MRIAVEGVRTDLWCRTCESVVPGRSRSTTARDLPANDCSRVSSGVDSEVESRPASADFESLTLRSRVLFTSLFVRSKLSLSFENLEKHCCNNTQQLAAWRVGIVTAIYSSTISSALQYYMLPTSTSCIL